MYAQFYDTGEKKAFWQPNQTIVLAVSGGVDSMVLFHLMARVAKKRKLQLVVAHVDHQLRAASQAEAAYLQAYCEKQHYPFFQKTWEDPQKERQTEARARAFRYAFFREIMTKTQAETVMTAHHQDDQAETVLMKLTRGSSFSGLVGIRDKQAFGSGLLIRPLLTFSKQTLYDYAQKAALTYFEDASNATDQYTRNRIRHHVIPVLKKENPQFLNHITQFHQQVDYANQLFSQFVTPLFQQWLQTTETGWQIALAPLKLAGEAQQYFFCSFLYETLFIPHHIAFNRQQIQQLLTLINSPHPQQQMDLGQSWQIRKTYEMIEILPKKEETSVANQTFILSLDQSFFLSKTEWIALCEGEQTPTFPEQTANWRMHTLLLSEQTALPLIIRHRQAGDRIQLTEHLRKKISRVFIDQKVPQQFRERAWLILSAAQEVLWLPNFANSCLSIPKETDKIHYRLLYRVKEN